jgi:predicted nucleotidyltransferase
LWLTRIRPPIKTVVDSSAGLDSVWLYGSALTVDDPRDLDLLAIYDRKLIDPIDAHGLAAEIEGSLAPTPIPVTVLLLHRREHLSSRFAEMERAERVWPLD